MADYGPRGIQIVRTLDGTELELDPVLYTCSASRDRAVCPGMFAVAETDGTLDGCRGVNDTTASGSGALLIKGLIAEVWDSTGNKLLTTQHAPTTLACKVRVYKRPTSILYRAIEDGTGGALTSYTTGSCPLADTAPTSTDTTDTFVPNPEANDKLDSSGYHATVTQHACNLQGLDPDVRNINNTNKVVLFKLNSAFCVS